MTSLKDDVKGWKNLIPPPSPLGEGMGERRIYRNQIKRYKNHLTRFTTDLFVKSCILKPHFSPHSLRRGDGEEDPRKLYVIKCLYDHLTSYEACS
jgi:hypothetical protein